MDASPVELAVAAGPAAALLALFVIVRCELTDRTGLVVLGGMSASAAATWAVGFALTALRPTSEIAAIAAPLLWALAAVAAAAAAGGVIVVVVGWRRRRQERGD